MVAVAHIAEKALIKASARFEILKQFSVASFVEYVYELSYSDS